MADYELTVVCGEKLTPAKSKAFIEKIEKLMEVFGGKVASREEWGEKELAYPIKSKEKAFFFYFLIECEGDKIKDLPLKLKMTPEIIRFLILKADETKRGKAAKPVLEEKKKSS